jgi:uncharacterized protein (DUF2267 family)
VDEPAAVRMAEACLMALHLRMPEEEARQLEGALPEEMRVLFAHGGEDLKERRGAVSEFNRQQLVQYVADRLGVRDATRAQNIVQTCFGVLREQLPEADRLVQRAVPADVRALWLAGAPRPR